MQMIAKKRRVSIKKRQKVDVTTLKHENNKLREEVNLLKYQLAVAHGEVMELKKRLQDKQELADNMTLHTDSNGVRWLSYPMTIDTTGEI